MKKTVLRALMYGFFFVMAFAVNSCNKPVTPPNVAGTWSSLENVFAIQIDKSVEEYDTDLEEKLIAAVNQMTDAHFDPQTIIISSDDAFRFLSAFGEIGSGICSIDKSGLITFSFTSGYYPENKAFAYSDGALMELFLHIESVKPVFLSALDVESEKMEALFREENPVITAMQASIIFKPAK